MAKKINPMLGIVGGLFAVLLLFAIIAVVFYPGPTTHEGAVDGDTLLIRYKGTFDNGTVFDSNENSQPYEVLLGEHKSIPGFEKELYGMKAGDRKTFRLAPEDAYPYEPDAVVTFEKDDVIEGLGSEPVVGEEIVYFNGYDMFTGIIVEVTETEVIIDFNLPVAGHYLTFEITILELHKGSGGHH